MKFFTLAALSCAGVLTVVRRARHHPSGAEAGHEQDGDRILLLGRSLARQPRGRSGVAPHLRARLRKRCRLFPRRQDAGLHRRIRWQRGRLHRPGIRRHSQARHLSPRCRPRGRAGLPTARAFFSAPTASASRDTRNFTRWRPKAAFPKRCRCRWAAWAHIRPTASACSTRRSMAASSRPASPTSLPGSAIAAARPAICG